MGRQNGYSRVYEDVEADEESCQACCQECEEDCWCARCCSLLKCGDKTKLLVFCSLLTFIYFLIVSLTAIPSCATWSWTPSLAAKILKGPTYTWSSSNSTEWLLTNDTIYVITPTYARPNQRSLLTALAQTFFFVPNCHWIIVEDSPLLSTWIADLMDRLAFNFTQIACHRERYCAKHTGCKGMSAKGSVSRNCALLWLRDSGIQSGVMYFADDDNFYDVRLFDEIRATKRVSLFPVGGFQSTGLSSPIMVGGQIEDFIDPWKAKRKWPIDMAGFATNLAFWRSHGSPIFDHEIGYLETRFLQAMNVSRESVEVLSDNATKIFVWHNHLGKIKCSMKTILWKTAMKTKSSNLDVLKEIVHC